MSKLISLLIFLIYTLLGDIASYYIASSCRTEENFIEILNFWINTFEKLASYTAITDHYTE